MILNTLMFLSLQKAGSNGMASIVEEKGKGGVGVGIMKHV